jgi:predicted phage terminase large subunit-like protein
MNKLTLDDLKAHLKNLPKLADKDRDKRIAKAKEDFYFAVKTYFPHHISKVETSNFRKYLYKEYKNILANKKATVEAYRGAAKTTLVSRLLPLYLMPIKKEKRHTVIVSSTLEVAKETLDFIKTELEDNENLISDFEIQKGDVWNSEEIIFISGGVKFRIKVYGAGTKIRGANWLGFRPDLIIGDDIENDENVESKNQRDKLYKWFIKAIMKLPSRQSRDYNIILVGTKLHHDSLLSRLQGRSDFFSLRFPLVLEFPQNIDNIDKKNIKKTDIKGMKLDDETLDKLELLKEYLEDKDSFMSEFQNEPLSKDGLTFNYTTFETAPICDAYFVGIDPALGKSKGDYFAITILGYSSSYKKYFATTKMYKIKATLMIDKIITLYVDLLRYQRPLKIAIEEVQFQEFFKDTLSDKAKEMGLFLPIVPLRNNIAKELRIDSISPLVNNGDILIDKNSLTLIDELDTYPKAPHDDGLDSLEMAYRIAKKPAFDYKEVKKTLQKFQDKNKALQELLSG